MNINELMNINDLAACISTGLMAGLIIRWVGYWQIPKGWEILLFTLCIPVLLNSIRIWKGDSMKYFWFKKRKI